MAELMISSVCRGKCVPYSTRISRVATASRSWDSNTSKSKPSASIFKKSTVEMPHSAQNFVSVVQGTLMTDCVAPNGEISRPDKPTVDDLWNETSATAALLTAVAC